QAIGRIGRGHVAGRVILQTSTPNSPLLHQAINKDWDDFYTSQLTSRRLHGFPPFTFLLQLECTRKRQTSAITASTKLKEALEQSKLPIDILGPVPAFHEKHNGEYTWQLVVRSSHRSALLT